MTTERVWEAFHTPLMQFIRRRVSDEPTAEDVLDLPEELPDDDVVSELLPCVREMVKNLPGRDRQALVLTEYQGLTQKELAERLGLSFSGHSYK